MTSDPTYRANQTCQTIIPATSCLPAVSFGCGYGFEKERPTKLNIAHTRCLIVGWRIVVGDDLRHDFVEPIFYEQLGRNHVVFIEVSGGRYHEAYNSNTVSFEEAKDAALKYFQDEWDKANKE